MLLFINVYFIIQIKELSFSGVIQGKSLFIYGESDG